MEVAQPLVRIFMHNEEIVHVIRALANSELSTLTYVFPFVIVHQIIYTIILAIQPRYFVVIR